LVIFIIVLVVVRLVRRFSRRRGRRKCRRRRRRIACVRRRRWRWGRVLGQVLGLREGRRCREGWRRRCRGRW
jgi:hypothetical protein